MPILTLSTTVLDNLWILPLLPLLGLPAWILRRRHRFAGFLVPGSSFLACLAWGLALWALSRLPEPTHRATVPWPLAQGHDLVLDQLSATMGLSLCALGALWQTFSLGIASSPPTIVRGALTVATGSVLVLSGDSPTLMVAWVLLSLLSYLWSDASQQRLRYPILLGSLSDGALAYGALALVGAGSTSLSNLSALAGPSGAATLATRVAASLCLAVLFRLSQMAISLSNTDGRHEGLLAVARMGSISLLPSCLYLVLRAQSLLMLLPTIVSVTHSVSIVVALVFSLLLLLQRKLAQALLCFLLAEAWLCIALSTSSPGPYTVYQIVFTMVAGCALCLSTALLCHSAQNRQGSWRLYALPGHDAMLVLSTVAFAALGPLTVPPLGGYYGKGVLLLNAVATENWDTWLVGMVGVAVLAYYLWRLVLYAYAHRAVDPVDPGEGPTDVMWAMWIPIVVLGLAMALAGFWARGLAPLAGLAPPRTPSASREAAVRRLSSSVPILISLAALVWAWLGERRSARWHTGRGVDPTIPVAVPVEGGPQTALPDSPVRRLEEELHRLVGRVGSQLVPEYWQALGLLLLLLLFLWAR